MENGQTEICRFQCFKEPTFLQLAKLALLGATGYTYLERLQPLYQSIALQSNGK